MKILNKLSFHKKIFLACLLTALVPLLSSSVVMIRLFTAALDRQNLDEGGLRSQRQRRDWKQFLKNARKPARPLPRIKRQPGL